MGPHTPQWDDGTFKRFADHCRRLSWLNATCEHVCDLAILTHDDRCPWPAAKVCLEHQRDFNYLDPTLLLEDATKASASGVSVAKMQYAMLVIDGDAPLSAPVRAKLAPLIAAGHVVRYGKAVDGDGIPASADAAKLVASIRHVCPDDVTLDKPAPGLRVRHLRHGDDHFYLFFNERPEPIEATVTLSAGGQCRWIRPDTGASDAASLPLTLRLPRYGLHVAHIR